ncbi:hypothetical protein [Caniella muris]|uniref:hypothetical protein n=1 Tax=Caniella muris TaxID=2941502 RepID=UPI0020408192|nr:hypothetical protein [Caniella muris]
MTRRLGRWAAAAAVAAALVAAPAAALAHTVTYVGSYDEAPVTEAYLDRLDGRMPDEVAMAPQVGVREVDGGALRYYVDDTAYSPESAPRTVEDALRLTYRKAGTTVDGRSLDVTVSMDVTWSHGGAATAGGLPTFLRTPGVSGCAFDWEAGSMPPAPGQAWDSGRMRIGVSVQNRLEVTLSDTGRPYAGRILTWIRDLDQWTGGPFSRETIELVSGFSDDVYVGDDTRLVRADLARGLFHPVDGSGDDGSHTDFVAYVEGGSARFRWQGEECSTAFRSIYPQTYPPIADDPVYDPVKSVAEVGGKAPADPSSVTAMPGQAVTFEVEQALPYVVESNKPRVVSIVDDLDGRFDPSTATVRVFQGGTDVTDNWKVTVSGRRVTATAVDTGRAVLGHTFRITARLRTGVTGTVLNKAVTTVVTRTQGDVEKTSNTVRVRVATVPRGLTVVKRVRSADLLDAHGRPAFPIKVTVRGATGTIAELYGIASFEDGGTDAGDGRVAVETRFDLAPFPPESVASIAVEEVPVSRYRLAAATGTGPWERVDRGLTLSYDDVPDMGELVCTLDNEKVVDRLFGHTAVSVNDLSAPREE